MSEKGRAEGVAGRLVEEQSRELGRRQSRLQRPRQPLEQQGFSCFSPVDSRSFAGEAKACKSVQPEGQACLLRRETGRMSFVTQGMPVPGSRLRRPWDNFPCFDTHHSA